MRIPIPGKTVFIFRRGPDEYRSLRIIILSVEQFPTEHHCVGNANIGWGNSFVQQLDVLIEERAFAFIVFGVPVILTQDQLGLYHKTAYKIKDEFHFIYIKILPGGSVNVFPLFFTIFIIRKITSEENKSRVTITDKHHPLFEFQLL